MHVVPMAELVRCACSIRTLYKQRTKICVPRTASTSSAFASLMSVSKMTICLLYRDASLPLSAMVGRAPHTHGRPKKYALL